MKKIATLLLSFLFVLAAFAQSNNKKKNSNKSQENCFEQYNDVFQKRGAYEVHDSTYNKVVITFSRGSSCDCFMGKVTVKNGEIDRNSMYLEFADGTFEKVDYQYQHNFPIAIINGISNAMVTKDGQVIHVLFPSKIKPKKKKYERAPMPNFDLN